MHKVLNNCCKFMQCLKAKFKPTAVILALLLIIIQVQYFRVMEYYHQVFALSQEIADNLTELNQALDMYSPLDH